MNNKTLFLLSFFALIVSFNLGGNFRLGDPARKDIAICIGYTAPKWALTKKSIERITTVFLSRNFNMLLADEQSDLPGITPGQIVFEDTGGGLVIPAENRGVQLNEVPPIRARLVKCISNPNPHSLLLQTSYIASPAELLPRWCQSSPSTSNSNRSWAPTLELSREKNSMCSV